MTRTPPAWLRDGPNLLLKDSMAYRIDRFFGVGLIALALCMAVPLCAQEVLYPSDDFAKLDTFEAVAVEDADKLFINKDYPGAYAAYKAYSIEFAQGRALPYVLLRMGRCLHLAGKRNTAVKAYQDVVDYFPNDVRYAAAAMYYIGQCHAQNGNEEKSLAVWAKMVKDKAYVGEANSGTALTKLAEAMQKRGDFGEAADYQWRTAVQFRKSNHNAAYAACSSVVYHYAVRSPNQGKLTEFCKEYGGLHHHHKIDKPEENAAYWSHVFNLVLKSQLKAEERVEVSRYWDSQMGDRFVENDALRVAWFDMRLAHDKNAEAWAKRMDEQFKRQPVTPKRVRDWVGHYSKFPKARSAFFKSYGEPLLSGIDNKEKLSLVRHLRHPHRMHDEARTVLQSVRTQGMDDPTLREYASYVSEYEGEEAFLRTVDKMKDKTYAARTRFDHFFRGSNHNGENRKKALAEVPVLSKSPDHVQDITWAHANLEQWEGNYEQAIKLYRAANRQPHTTWAVIECRLAMKQHAKAVQLCEELYSIKSESAKACFKIADIYRASGDKGKEVTQLQLVLRRHKGTTQASEAHGRLERYGVKIIGGEAEAEE